MATFWVSSGLTPQKSEWLQLAFATPQTVSAMKIVGRPGYGPKQCALQVSDDGKNFRTVHEFTLESGVEDIVPFAPVKATTFRFAFSSANDRTNPDAPRSVQVSEISLMAPDGSNVK